MAKLSLFAGLCCFLGSPIASAALVPSEQYCSVFDTDSPSVDCLAAPSSFLSFSKRGTEADAKAEASSPPSQDLDNIFNALAVLQNDYFDTQNNTWSTAIDWTAAVIETVVSATLTTLTTSLDGQDSSKNLENFISFYYNQVAASYFGQNTTAIKGQAYDDILWVVLGWIEAIKFVETHASLYFGDANREHECSNAPTSLSQAIKTVSWHGYTWFCSYARRANEFYKLSQSGWDTTLCHGGMVWNPRLEPYKNAITNELYIAGSISMYQRYPGDGSASASSQPNGDPSWLQAAKDGYEWITHVNMTNNQGLYADGFHVDKSKPGNVECDQRDEMVYTYNQGVILTGQRGLWEVTGSPSYLQDGHKLIQSVIAATGYELGGNVWAENMGHTRRDELPPWKGLGRGGILEEQCDSSGTCSQDGQTFKGIFFHHFTAFCAPVSATPGKRGASVNTRAYSQVKKAHTEACQSYLGWVKGNADAALKTRDGNGHFGMWWGAGAFNDVVVSASSDGINHSAANVTDYRNHGTPQDKIWGELKWTPGTSGGGLTVPPGGDGIRKRAGDPNDRGRGRTVETQTGGLSLLRAYWELSRLQ